MTTMNSGNTMTTATPTPAHQPPMTALFLKPCDVLLFRDGRPFGAGSEHTARSLFPPLPGTLYGALRSALLAQRGVDLTAFADGNMQDKAVSRELGRPEQTGTMAMTGFSILQRREGRRPESFLPAPLDLVRFPGDRFALQAPLRPESAAGVFPDRNPGWLLPCWLPTGDHPGKGSPGLIPREAFAAALAGRVDDVREACRTAVAPGTDAEFRTGIARCRTRRTVETGKLYTAEFKRLVQPEDAAAELGFEIVLAGVDVPETLGWLRIGGDARAAAVERLDRPIEPDLRLPPNGNRLKLVLLTPAIFVGGWLPGWIDAATGRGTWHGVDLQLVSLCMGKPVPVGGYDLVENRPKPMQRAVPAGSVWYFEVTGGNPASLAGIPSISDERAQEGFGLFATGGFDYV